MNRRQWAMLLWKELEEDRWFFYAGAVAFIVLPLFASVFSLGGDFLLMVVLILGSLLAVLVGVGTACRDLRGVETFWRSRPIDARRWLAVKYIIGLLVVQIIQATALSAQVGVVAFVLRQFQFFAFFALIFNSFTLALIYSVAFLLGCLIRRAVPAAILSLAAVLLIYFLPVLFRSMAWLSTYNQMRNMGSIGFADLQKLQSIDWSTLHTLWRLFPQLISIPQFLMFAGVMAGCSIALAMLAGEVVYRDWRLRVNGQLMAWTLGGLALLVFGAGANQLGTNLHVERVINLNAAGKTETSFVERVILSGNRGVAFMSVEWHHWDRSRATGMIPPGIGFESVAPIDLDQAQPIGAPLILIKFFSFMTGSPLVWTPDSPNRIYGLNGPGNLGVYDLRGHPIAGLSLPVDSDQKTYFQGYQSLFLDDGRLYCYPVYWANNPQSHLLKHLPVLAISLKDPEHPRIEQALDGPWPNIQQDIPWGAGFFAGAPATCSIPLPHVPGLSARQKLNFCIRGSSPYSLNGDILVTVDGSLPRVWQLILLNQVEATFKLIGSAEYSPLERLTLSFAEERYHNQSGSTSNPFLVHDQRVYVVRDDVNMGVSVYDIRDPSRPVEVGHFVAPNDWISGLAPLPNGRVLVTGYHLYVLAPPR